MTTGGCGAAFARPWASRAAHDFGDGLAVTAGALLAAALTRNPALVAGLWLAQRLPWVVLALASGVLVAQPYGIGGRDESAPAVRRITPPGCRSVPARTPRVHQAGGGSAASASPAPRRGRNPAGATSIPWARD